MRNTIYIFLVFVLVFFLNLLLYIYVDSYRTFIKILKYGDENISYENPADDSYNVNSIEYKENDKTDLEKGLLLDLGIQEEQQNVIVTPQITVEEEVLQEQQSISERLESSREEIVAETKDSEEVLVNNDIGRPAGLTAGGERVISAFQRSGFEILEKLEKDDLLDIASEYPDEYIQYGDNNFDLYILSSRTYDEVEDIFGVLEYEMPFALNKQNNFGDRSFFINLDRTDTKVRFIFETGGEVYGVKVRTSNYNAVKSIINTL